MYSYVTTDINGGLTPLKKKN